MVYIGIDPGQGGGVAVIVGNDSLTGPHWVVEKWTGEADMRDWLVNELDLAAGKIIDGEPERYRNTFALLERVHSMPKQGVSSTFKFGQNYGFWRGLLCAFRIPYEEVSPGVWQKAMGCLSGGDKNVTKAKAAQLFPQIKVTHAIADALLIAEYCCRLRNGVPS